MFILLPCSLILVLLSLHLHQTFALLSSSFPSPSLLETRDTAPQSYTNTTTFKDSILNITNAYRKQHNATALKWNDTLADMSQKWSDGCTFEHSGNPTGENLSAGYPNATSSVVVWGQERTHYDYAKASFSSSTGHFTQLVWKATTSVGCGRSECNGEKGKKGKEAPGWYVVCEYWPPGNVVGQFAANVQGIVEGGGEDGGDGGEVPTATATGTGAGPSETAKCPQGGVCSAGVRGRVSLWGLGVVVGVGAWWVW